MSHLGDRVAALVDGQLTAEAVDRATMHLVNCRVCRDLVELERGTKLRLITLVGPEPTPDLVGRLLAMGGPAGPLPPRPGHVPGNPRPRPVSVRPSVVTGARNLAQRGPVTTTHPAGRPPVLSARRARLAAAFVGALSVVGVGVAGVAVGGGSSAVQRPAPVSADTFVTSTDARLIGASPSAPFELFRTPPDRVLGDRLIADR